MEDGRREPFGYLFKEGNDMDIEKKKLIYKLYMKHRTTNYIQEKLQEKFESGSDHRTILKLIEDEKWDVKRDKKDKKVFDKILAQIENEEISSVDILNKMVTTWLRAFSEGKIDVPSNKILLEAIKIIHLLKDNPIEGSDRLEKILKKSLKKE